MSRKAKVFIGTSGWNYFGWREGFYPADLKPRDYLGYYAQHFKTVEVNYSFYHLPTQRTYRNWAAQVPAGFVFSVKASRWITHIQRLHGTAEAWQKFTENALVLGDRLGPVLLQFPPSLKLDLSLLQAFLEEHAGVCSSGQLRLGFEFRHASWFNDSVYSTLKSHGAVLVLGHSQRYPLAPLVDTAEYVYLRFHGPGQLFASAYSDEALADWAGLIRDCLSRRRTVYAYFNNDFRGFAVRNARSLLQLI
jgi:uncharacterized protein YecE (DUF72 family)